MTVAAVVAHAVMDVAAVAAGNQQMGEHSLASSFDVALLPMCCVELFCSRHVNYKYRYRSPTGGNHKHNNPSGPQKNPILDLFGDMHHPALLTK